MWVRSRETQSNNFVALCPPPGGFLGGFLNLSTNEDTFGAVFPLPGQWIALRCRSMMEIVSPKQCSVWKFGDSSKLKQRILPSAWDLLYRGCPQMGGAHYRRACHEPQIHPSRLCFSPDCSFSWFLRSGRVSDQGPVPEQDSTRRQDDSPSSGSSPSQGPDTSTPGNPHASAFQNAPAPRTGKTKDPALKSLHPKSPAHFQPSTPQRNPPASPSSGGPAAPSTEFQQRPPCPGNA